MDKYGWIEIEEDGECITSMMPADDDVVEVKLRDGSVRRAWYGANIGEPGDYDFVEMRPDGEPDFDGSSLADRVVAWREIAEPAP